MDKISLTYRNETDRCYGAAGMAIAIVVFDSEEMLAGVDIDAEPNNIIDLDQEFFFAGNPGLSAKSAWTRILSNFNISMAMTIANAMCRSVILDRKPLSFQAKQLLRDHVLEEGAASCSLEEEETSRLFDKNYTYLTRVFNHQGVRSVADDFVTTLRDRRRMSRMEVVEALRALSML